VYIFAFQMKQLDGDRRGGLSGAFVSCDVAVTGFSADRAFVAGKVETISGQR